MRRPERLRAKNSNFVAEPGNCLTCAQRKCRRLIQNEIVTRRVDFAWRKKPDLRPVMIDMVSACTRVRRSRTRHLSYWHLWTPTFEAVYLKCWTKIDRWASPRHALRTSGSLLFHSRINNNSSLPLLHFNMEINWFHRIDFVWNNRGKQHNSIGPLRPDV